MLNRCIDLCCRALGALMVLCLVLMVVMVFINVVLRYAFNSGINVSEELSRWLFVWMTFMGAVVALRERGHLGTDMLVSLVWTKMCLSMLSAEFASASLQLT
jgi:TRAP-type C4-dicarboxylate transport system permease small subunit